MEEQINEFKSCVESGFGKIYSDDLSKYWSLLFGENLTEECRTELERLLDDRDLMITAD